ncbi:hypothetical protein Nepgr_006562 [Nepenthes gracilis]|uniref:Uncharacterized protein n=1 Tax=Nepenthes gracilis TaxID=150966 RepID=A0AAD3XHG0_NEPGR|nr:hypothetical protein Nepgr_006562 [Nepenthes gracilis]
MEPRFQATHLATPREDSTGHQPNQRPTRREDNIIDNNFKIPAQSDKSGFNQYQYQFHQTREHPGNDLCTPNINKWHQQNPLPSINRLKGEHKQAEVEIKSTTATPMKKVQAMILSQGK